MDPNQGKCIGVMVYDNVVQFWCESLSGGVTDTVIVPIAFSSYEMAVGVAGTVVRGIMDHDRAVAAEALSIPREYSFGSISFKEGE